MEEGQATTAPEQSESSEVLGQENTISEVQQGDAKIKVTTNDEVHQRAMDQDSDWIQSLDPNLQEYVSKKGFKNSKAVLESYINLEKLRGVPEDRLLKLPESSDDPRWKEVYQKLGAPENAEGYEFSDIETDEAKGFAEWASKNFHELNITKSQAQGLVKRYENLIKESQAEQEQLYNKTVEQQEVELKKDWGAAFHQNIAKVRQTAKDLNIPGEAIDAMEKTMGYDGVMKFIHSLSTKIGESDFVGGDQAVNPNAKLTPDQAKAKIDALKKDKSFVDKYLSGDMEARQEMSRLHKFLTP